MRKRGNEDTKLELGFFKSELSDHYVYESLAGSERHAEIRTMLKKLSNTEEKHAGMWRKRLKENGISVDMKDGFTPLRVLSFRIAGLIFGVALEAKMLERDERNGVEAYNKALKKTNISDKERACIRAIMKEEEQHKKELSEESKKYEGNLHYIRSIVFGLNDGLVELLAVVVGLAVLATSGIVVVIGGLIVGISGTLSMAGGAYLSSKSEGLVDNAIEKENRQRTKPFKEGIFTGVYYFLGSLVSIIPFALGLSGYSGIIVSIILVMITLIAASVIIAIASDTSIRKRTFEMLAISLTAAFITIMLGTLVRTYFGISI